MLWGAMVFAPMCRRAAAGLVALVLATTLAWAVAEPSTAAATCAYKSGGFDGYLQSGHSDDHYEGSSADIVVQDGALCSLVSGPPSIYRGLSSWVMIAGGAGSSSYGGAWAQVGFTKTSSTGTMRWFSQYNENGYLTGRLGSFSVDSQFGLRHFFREEYDPSTGYFDSIIDRDHWDSSTFDPYASSSHWGPQPWSPQFAEEATDPNTYVPGTSSHRANCLG